MSSSARNRWTDDPIACQKNPNTSGLAPQSFAHTSNLFSKNSLQMQHNPIIPITGSCQRRCYLAANLSEYPPPPPKKKRAYGQGKL
ncbi:hypothetical protein GWI33_001674 [Rhynchophorus ferrugineus]|uniref:Uncharacterized protein n=1 Tax=Rhynchophorus ferrugineus TaxID=354439 RepID=A0A834MPG2_RHYFE|nr:hypothetical protein GWI33_001674 [Rhynchophorus ferrugineus]